MKKFLIILSLIYFQPVFSSETVLICITKGSTGFDGIETTPSQFIKKGLTLSFNNDYKLLKMSVFEKRDKTFSCNFTKLHPDELFCIEDSTVPYIFLYHKKNKKFTYFEGTILGYPSEGTDSTAVSIGTCREF